MRQAPSLSFLKILTTSERMQYLRPLTPGSGGRSNGSSSSSAKSKAQLRGSGAGTVGTRTRSRRTKGAAGTRRQKTKQPPRSSSSGGGKAAGGATGAENRPDTQQQQERLGSQLEKIDALEKHISLLAQEGEALTTEIKDDLDQERQAAEALAQARKLAGVADDSTSGGGGGGGLQRSASAFTMQDMLDMAGENKPPKKEEWNSSGLHPNE
jgi:hypothetical protein